MKNFAMAIAITLFCSVFSFAQPRPMEKQPDPQTTATPAPSPAPESFAAKYEGGMYGFSKKEQGTLKFDDENDRLLFFGKDNKQWFAIPYKSLLVVYPQSKSVTSTTGQVIKNIPFYGVGLLGGFIKEKRRYLVINFDDPDIDAKGLTNFKLENKELLDSVIAALAEKAKLKQRGDAFYRPSQKKDESVY